jgi:monoamine oxidase
MQHNLPRVGRLGLLVTVAGEVAAQVHSACSDNAEHAVPSTPVPLPVPSSRPTRAEATERDLDVIVIGAGVAGLSAARALTDAGKNVIVVEARDRIGGRMWTHTEAMSIPVELGAQFIHGRNASTWELVRRQGLETYTHGNTYSRTSVGGPWKKKAVCCPYNFQVIGGYSQILAPLAHDLSIDLNTVVRRVEYKPGTVLVHAEQKGRELTYAAHALVVALPVAVLNANVVEFSPPLPKEKLDTFKSMPHVAITKVMMEFDRPVFPQNADEVIEAGRPMYLMNGAMGDPRYSGRIILAGAEEHEAERLLAMPPEQRHREFLEVIRGVAGDHTLKPVKVVEHEWAKDPFALAAFTDSWSITGVRKIYEPVMNTLFWAGVVTDQVDLSYKSGKQAATKLLSRLQRSTHSAVHGDPVSIM